MTGQATTGTDEGKRPRRHYARLVLPMFLVLAGGAGFVAALIYYAAITARPCAPAKRWRAR